MAPGEPVAPGEPLRVRMGEFLVRDSAEAPDGLSIRGLGSCVAVFLHEPARRLGGLAHVLLPCPDARSPLTAPGRFAPTAVAAMLDLLFQRGGSRRRIVARLSGGASMFPASSTGLPNGEPLGERNIRAALEALHRESIRVVAMDIGGSAGRSVLADLTSGRLHVHRLRQAARIL